MKKIVVLIVSAAINASTIPALASECMSNKDIETLHASRPTARSQPASAADTEKICRAYAALFYESVTLRQAAAKCIHGERNLTVLDSEINAYNDLLAAKCGS